MIYTQTPKGVRVYKGETCQDYTLVTDRQVCANVKKFSKKDWHEATHALLTWEVARERVRSLDIPLSLEVLAGLVSDDALAAELIRQYPKEFA